MNKIKRRDDQAPPAIAAMGWRYHHLGIPTKKSLPGERHLPHLKIWVSGFDTSPFGVEWMRFDPGCRLDPLIKTVPHLAFEVDDLDAELKKYNFEVIYPPGAPSAGVRAAMIRHDGAPIELIEFKKGGE